MASKPKDGDEGLEAVVERAISSGLGNQMTTAERTALLAVAVRYLAVKNKLLNPEHGSGFEEDD